MLSRLSKRERAKLHYLRRLSCISRAMCAVTACFFLRSGRLGRSLKCDVDGLSGWHFENVICLLWEKLLGQPHVVMPNIEQIHEEFHLRERECSPRAQLHCPKCSSTYIEQLSTVFLGVGRPISGPTYCGGDLHSAFFHTLLCLLLLLVTGQLLFTLRFRSRPRTIHRFHPLYLKLSIQQYSNIFLILHYKVQRKVQIVMNISGTLRIFLAGWAKWSLQAMDGFNVKIFTINIIGFTTFSWMELDVARPLDKHSKVRLPSLQVCPDFLGYQKVQVAIKNINIK